MSPYSWCIWSVASGGQHASARKTHAIALDAFRSPWLGPLGYVDAGQVRLLRRPTRHLTLAPPEVESRVDLLTLVAGSDGHDALLVRDAIEIVAASVGSSGRWYDGADLFALVKAAPIGKDETWPAGQ